MQRKNGYRDAPAQGLADALRTSRALITGILAGSFVLAVIVAVLLPNVVALLGEVR